MFQNFFERTFIVILCCAGIFIGTVILGIMGIDVHKIQTFSYEGVLRNFQLLSEAKVGVVQ